MNIIFILIKRELLKLNKNLFFYILFMTLFPLVLYAIISVPLSLLVLDIKPVYNSWSAGGIWVVTTLFSSYAFSFILFKSLFDIESFFSLPITPYKFLIFSYSYSLIIAFIQLSISILFIGTLNNDFMHFIHFMLLLILFVPVVILITNFAYITTQFINNGIPLLIIHLLVFLTISFNYGAFIPLKYFPDNYTRFVDFLPIPGLINNSQKIISSEAVSFSLFLISSFISAVLSLLVFFNIEKKITNK